MLLLPHIVIALSSLAFATFMYVSPSKLKVRISYALVAGTLTTGTILVASTGTRILQACITGLVYLAVVATLTVFTQRKLAPESTKR